MKEKKKTGHAKEISEAIKLTGSRDRTKAAHKKTRKALIVKPSQDSPGQNTSNDEFRIAVSDDGQAMTKEKAPSVKSSGNHSLTALRHFRSSHK